MIAHPSIVVNGNVVTSLTYRPLCNHSSLSSSCSETRVACIKSSCSFMLSIDSCSFLMSSFLLVPVLDSLALAFVSTDTFGFFDLLSVCVGWIDNSHMLHCTPSIETEHITFPYLCKYVAFIPLYLPLTISTVSPLLNMVFRAIASVAGNRSNVLWPCVRILCYC